MFIIKYYLMIAAACALAAFYIPNPYFSVILGWISLSLTAVSFAYISDSPWIFRKNDRGNIPIYIQWIFVPFLLGAQLYNSWQRRNDSVPVIQKIDDNLFLACRLFPSDMEELKRLNITAILDATAEFSGMNWSADDENLDYLNVPILDHQVPKSDDVIKAINWIHNHTCRDRAVVVHCALGRGRSVFIVAAYMLAAKLANCVDDAMQQINRIRGTARLNGYQYKKLLTMYEDGLLNLKVSALLVANPVSGGSSWQEAQATVEQVLGQKYQLKIQLTEKNKSVKESLQHVSLKDFTAVFACGGDGTVNAVADAIEGLDVSFGIIPLGTTNALSHVLYGNKVKIAPVSHACEAILQERLVEIDAARCNQRIMLLALGIGFAQKMIKGAGRDQKDSDGQLAYISALFDALKENESKRYRVTFDGADTCSLEASSILVANAAPFTTFLAQGKGQPNPTDGKLDVTILNTQASASDPISKLTVQALSQGSFDIEESDDFQYHLVDEILIQSDAPIDFVIDGELHQAPEVLISIMPKAFRVFTHTDIDFEPGDQ